MYLPPPGTVSGGGGCAPKRGLRVRGEDGGGGCSFAPARLATLSPSTARLDCMLVNGGGGPLPSLWSLPPPPPPRPVVSLQADLFPV